MTQLLCLSCEKGGLKWKTPDAEELFDTPMVCSWCGHEYPNMKTYHDEMLEQPKAGAVPDGYALVPVEPTRAMLLAGSCQSKTKDIYTAMLAASQEPDHG